MDLETAARREGRSLADLLEDISRRWLCELQSADGGEEQARLHAVGRRFAGSLEIDGATCSARCRSGRRSRRSGDDSSSLPSTAEGTKDPSHSSAVLGWTRSYGYTESVLQGLTGWPQHSAPPESCHWEMFDEDDVIPEIDPYAVG